MALPYEAPRSYTAASGGIPVVVDPADALKKSIAATQTNLSSVKDLGRKTDNFMVNQYTGRVPGYKAMSEQSSANIASALRGEVPQDVLNQMAQQAAERGISRGVPGAQASNADYLRGLGLTSLGLQKYGEEALTGATHRLDAVKQFDPTTFSVTPEAQYNAMTQANVLGAAPDPEAVYQRGKADLNTASKTTPGQTYSNLAGSGGASAGVKPTSASPNYSPVIGYGTRPDSGVTSSYSPWDINGNWAGGSNAANNVSDFGGVGSFTSSLPFTGAGSIDFPGTNTGNIYDPTTGYLDLYGTGAVGSGIPGAGPYEFGTDTYDDFDIYDDIYNFDF